MISAYVANLAAILNQSNISNDSVTTMGEAVARGVKICAHPALKDDMLTLWPNANFYFHQDANEFSGMLDDYDAGKCKVMAVGYEDTSMDVHFLQGLCDRGLVYTDSVIVEIPVAFPIIPSLASGFSYWMYLGGKNGVTIQASKDKFSQDIACNIKLLIETTGGSNQLNARNMFGPIIVFTFCALIAIMIQLFHVNKIKKGGESLVGRRSSLCLVKEVKSKNIAKQDYEVNEDFAFSDSSHGEKDETSQISSSNSNHGDNSMLFQE